MNNFQLEVVSTFKDSSVDALDEEKGWPLMIQQKASKDERNSWKFVIKLFKCRSDIISMPFVDESTDSGMVQSLLESNQRVSELLVIRNWLEDTCDIPVPIEIQANWNTSGPDFIQTKEEKAFDAKLCKALFFYLRKGQMEDAIDCCERNGQHWRSASLKGVYYYDGQEGNSNMAKWKESCRNICLNDEYSLYERALYAVLCGEFEVLDLVCSSWEDKVWAYTVCLLEKIIQNHLDGGSFEEYRESLAGFVHSLSVHDYYHQFQMSIMLGDLKGLVTRVVEDPLIEDSHLQFAANFFIFLNRSTAFKVECDALIEKFIKRLIDQNIFDFVASFCDEIQSQEIATDLYSYLLLKVDSSEDRLKYLRKASQLDSETIVVRVCRVLCDSDLFRERDLEWLDFIGRSDLKLEATRILCRSMLKVGDRASLMKLLSTVAVSDEEINGYKALVKCWTSMEKIRSGNRSLVPKLIQFLQSGWLQHPYYSSNLKEDDLDEYNSIRQIYLQEICECILDSGECLDSFVFCLADEEFKLFQDLNLELVLERLASSKLVY